MLQKKSFVIKSCLLACTLLFTFSANATHQGRYDSHGNYVPGPAHHGGGYNNYGGAHNPNPVYNRHGGGGYGGLVCATRNGSCAVASHARAGNSCRCGHNRGYVQATGGTGGGH